MKNSIPKYDYEIEFLKTLDRTPYSGKLFDLNTYWLQRFIDLGVSVDKLHEFYLTNGYLRLTLFEEDLSIIQLKSLLKDNNISTTGNKELLIDKVINLVINKNYRIELRQFFAVTKKGRVLISSDEFRFQNEFNAYFELIYILINENRIEEAIKIENVFRKSNPDQRQLGFNVKDEIFISEKSLIYAQYFSKNPLLHFNSKLPFSLNKELTLLLTCYVLMLSANNKYLITSINKNLENLDFSAFRTFYLQNINSEEHIELKKLAVKFLLYEYSHIYNLIDLEVISKEIFRKKYMGIEVMNSKCKCCSILGEERFYWVDIDNIPKLPRGLYCYCFYTHFPVI